MKTNLTFKGLAIFYMLVAFLTYALINRTERLEENKNQIRSNNIVINLW